MDSGQQNEDNLSLRYSFQVILGCAKLKMLVVTMTEAWFSLYMNIPQLLLMQYAMHMLS